MRAFYPDGDMSQSASGADARGQCTEGARSNEHSRHSLARLKHFTSGTRTGGWGSEGQDEGYDEGRHILGHLRDVLAHRGRGEPSREILPEARAYVVYAIDVICLERKSCICILCSYSARTVYTNFFYILRSSRKLQ